MNEEFRHSKASCLQSYDKLILTSFNDLEYYLLLCSVLKIVHPPKRHVHADEIG